MAPTRQASLERQPSISSQVSEALGKLKQGPDATWDKDMMLDVVFWARVLLSLAVGVLYGVIGLTGGMPFLMYLAGSFMAAKAAYTGTFGVHDDDVTTEHLMEGFPVGTSAFLLAWTLTHSAMRG